ncbi:hypothetical protein CCAX7_001070 [Capsulimonas corticalis]|uniref:Uncharacterized protein n=1 Tax=Capsulimonas corticalis TaxID=2219043 RepID=A0A402CRT7_9BACT|nr:DUF192 domain-containing protein [Capsulimonas corticalis]BDI28056.1 hypothetical protein CCAX7_001070 [Capsulimonas corticalis]
MAVYPRFTLTMESSGLLLGSVAQVNSWLGKGVGVLGRRALPAGEGLWLPDVASVHTWFVAFPLDILFLSRDLTVLAVCPNVPPWRALVRCPGAVHTIEMGAGTLANLPVPIGERLRTGPEASI